MYQPLVTIIIPVYNGANYLAESINAALSQTYKNLEIIVVNDGSNDNGETERVALSYGDKITYLSKENGGVSSALNVAIEKMHGEWFSWLSHDDLYLPDKIEAQIVFLNELLAKQKDIDVERTVLYCKNYTINTQGKIIKKKIFNLPVHCNKQQMVLKHIQNYRIGGCAVLVPRKAFDHVGPFDESIRTASDKEYWFRLINHNYQFYFLNKRLVKNRVHKKQVGKVYNEKMLIEGDLLNTQIVKDVWEVRTTENWRYFLKLGCYLTKRNHIGAAKTAFDFAKLLSNNSVAYRMSKGVGIAFYKLKGKLFFSIRTIWRKAVVK